MNTELFFLLKEEAFILVAGSILLNKENSYTYSFLTIVLSFFLIEVELIYSIVLLSGIQQSDSIYVHSTYGGPLIAQLVRNLPAMQETSVRFLGQEDTLRRDRLPTPVCLGFSCGSAGKESACNTGDLGLIPGLGRSCGEGKGYPLQYSGLENAMDYIVHGVAKSQT